MKPMLKKLAPPQFPMPWACEWGVDNFGPWQLLRTRKGAQQRFRWVPPGQFTIGSPESEKGRFDHEPQQNIDMLEGFWLGEGPVSQALYLEVQGKNPSHFNDADGWPQLPVENVSWLDAAAFCTRLSEWLAMPLILPHEIMWEYACRAGTSTAFSFGDEIDLTNANYGGQWDWNEPDSKASKSASNRIQPQNQTSRPGQYSANDWGFWDMHGNVWEWCANTFEEDPKWAERFSVREFARQVANEQSKAQEQLKSLRGGSWCHVGRLCRSAYRSLSGAADADYGFGLRLALGPEL